MEREVDCFRVSAGVRVLMLPDCSFVDAVASRQVSSPPYGESDTTFLRLAGDGTFGVTGRVHETEQVSQRLLDEVLFSADNASKQPGMESRVEDPGSISKSLIPGVSALSTRVALLALRGDLHIGFGRLVKEIALAKTPLSSELVDRIDTMKADNWRFWEMPYKYLDDFGQYDARAREVVYARDRSIAGYVLGADNQHPRESMVTVLAHEVAHNEGLKHFPLRFLEGQTVERLEAFRLLAHETNALMAEMHVEQHRNRIAISGDYHEALKCGELGAEIRAAYMEKNSELRAITELEATEFVSEYIGERWGNPLDADGKVRSYKLNPTTSAALAESAIYDPPGIDDHAADFRNERIQMDSESMRYKIARLCQSNAGAVTIHGIKVLGALGAVAAVHTIRNSFNDSFSSGLAESTRMGIGFGGFELGTALARFGSVAPIRRALVFGFLGAYAAEHTLGTTVYNHIRSALE